ncbi:MAG: macro domain-containing protein [Phycisphaerales bacterium]|nr:macro domain-containing protein [Hyphomonadaceae bacterium]
MAAPFEVLIGRLETLAVDAIVTSANRDLMPGGGLDAAIRQAAGPSLTAHTNGMSALDPGEAALTPGFNLPARHIIHTAPPLWAEDGAEGEKVAALAGCYMSALKLARLHAFASLAFPCLGTGHHRWPRGFACAIAVAACEQALQAAPLVKRLIFCCLTEDDARLYRAAFA